MVRKIKLERGSILTLTEVIILLVILFILFTYVSSSMSRNYIAETAAMANIRIIHNICQLNHSNSGNFPESLSSLSSSGLQYLDPELASGHKHDYLFTYNLLDNNHFSVRADPDPHIAGLARGRHFYIDETGVIHLTTAQRQAEADDPILK